MAYVQASPAKGPCNRLVAIYELPVTREIAIVRLLLFLLTALYATSPGHASARTPQTSNCGSDVASAISRASQAVDANDPQFDHEALVCLLRAIELLQSAQVIVKRGEDNHPMLHAPALPGKAGHP